MSAAADNAARNGVAERLEAGVSDVFDAVQETDGPFDLVIFDPPYRWFEPRDLLEMATADPGYGALTRFMREVRAHLSPNGGILLAFATSGDLRYLRWLIEKEVFRFEVVASKTLLTDVGEVEYVVHRLGA